MASSHKKSSKKVRAKLNSFLAGPSQGISDAKLRLRDQCESELRGL